MSRKKENRVPFSTTVDNIIMKKFEKIIEDEGLVKTKAVDKAIMMYIENFYERSNKK